MKRLLFVIPVAVMLSACGSSSEPTPSSSPSMTQQIANPASVYCESVGGTLEIVTNADGQQGMCHLPDGTVVDEWDLYRSANPTPSA